jgi:hypothetical protein
LDENVKNKFHTKLKSTSKYIYLIKIDRNKSLNIKTRHINEYKDKIKDSPIHECVGCERLCFKLQTFHLTKTKTQQLTKYIFSLEMTKPKLSGNLFVLYLYKVNCY